MSSQHLLLSDGPFNLIRLYFSLILVFWVLATHADTISVASASNFMSTLKNLVELYELESPHKVQVSYGSSGKLYTQIRHGAPFELFLSADQHKCELLEKEGYSMPGSRRTYARGRLALWRKHKQVGGVNLSTLQAGSFRKLAMANPNLAPYGAAALEFLEAEGLVTKTKQSWVVGENIAQAFQYVFSGNAEIGLVALAQVLSLPEEQAGDSWIVPDALYHPINQDLVILKKGENAATISFWKFLLGETAQEVIARSGYLRASSSRASAE